MPHQKLPFNAPCPNHTPRREAQKTRNVRHERFAHEYLVDFDPGAAYLRAGYKAANKRVAQICASRLLSSAIVLRIIEAERLKRIEATRVEAQETVQRLKLVYLMAMTANDFRSAIAALRELGKHFGLYEQHNTARRST